MFFRRSDKEVTESDVSRAYKRAAIGLGVAAVLWFLAWLYARREGWEDRNLFIPVGCAALSITFYLLYTKSKPTDD